MGLCVLNHAVNFLVGQSGGTRNGDLLGLVSCLVLSGDLQDTVCVDVKGDLNLRDTALSSRDASKVELTKALVVRSHLTLALKDVNLNGGLVISCGGVNLCAGSWDSGVTVDDLVNNTAKGLNAQGQWGYVQQQDAGDIAGKNAALNSCAVCNNLVWVDGHVRLLAGHALDQVLNSWHTSGAADQNDLADIGELKACVLECLGYRSLAAVEKIAGDALKLCTSQSVVKVLRTRCVCGDKWQVNLCLLSAGELLLGVLCSLLEALKCHWVLAEVNAVIGVELVCKPVDNALIPVVTAQVVVAVGCENLNNAVCKIKQGDVEGTATEVEDKNLVVLVLLVQTVSKSCCGWLINDTLNVEASNLTCVLSCLTLCVVEVCRDGNDSVGYRLTEVLLGVCLHLCEDHSADLLWGVVNALNLNNRTTVGASLNLVRDSLDLRLDLIKLAAHETLDGENSVYRVSNSLVLCCLTNNAVTVSTEADDGRSCAVSLCVYDNSWLSTLKDSHS